MKTMHDTHRPFAEIRRRISEAITHTLQPFVASERERMEEALALLASDRTIHPESVRTILAFYNGGETHREAFFKLLASLEPPRIEYALNQIYAAMDTPEWLIGLRADLLAL
ncbi:MAG: hypothetical protein NT045_08775, partial [Candidatus Aureabacteria bacterium]|nr:hypothetical protein [Candidatus Auribacterota bacterium]